MDNTMLSSVGWANGWGGPIGIPGGGVPGTGVVGVNVAEG